MLTLGVTPARSFCIDANAVLRSTRPHERPTPCVLLRLLIDEPLHPHGLDELPLRVGRLEPRAVWDKDLDETVRKVNIGRVPLLGSPSAVDEHDEDEEEIREGIADGLVDEKGEVAEVGDRRLLSGRPGGVGSEGDAEGGRKQDSAMAVGFEVDADVVTLGGVVEVLDSGRDASCGDPLLKRAEPVSRTNNRQRTRGNLHP